ALRRLAISAPVGLIETSGGQEDVQSFAWEAAENLRTALRHARVVTACELLTAYQAHALSDHPPPAGCGLVLDWLATVLTRGDDPPEPPDGQEVPMTSSWGPRPGPVLTDRPFGEDIERIAEASPAWL